MEEQILQAITDYFVSSSDFNGILLSSFCEDVDKDWPGIRDVVIELLRNGKISLAFLSHSGNPHIKRLPDLSFEEQFSRLDNERPDGICAYPTDEVIKGAIDVSKFDDRPFTKRLVLAEAQLTPVYFSLDVLEKYYRDPRYRFDFYDYAGSIGLTSKHYESEDTEEKDRSFIQSFGIGYDERKNRVVVVYLRYLFTLTPEHQQIWAAHISSRSCVMNGDYASTSLYGAWPKYHSVYRAFLAEQYEINKICEFLDRKPLFREVFKDSKPRGFFPMLRPTRANFHEFVQILDKMLSDNMDIEFFKNEIDTDDRVTLNNGVIEVRKKASLRILQEWLKASYKTSDGEDASSEVVEPFKYIRKIRQKPAHELGEDEYDSTFPAQQDELLGAALISLTKPRLILSAHPMAKGKYTVPDWMDGGDIVFY